jgi:hypothetical protein
LAALVATGVVVALVLAHCLPDLPPTPPPTCGSGIVDLEDGETCDPGDASAQGCNAFCQVQCEGGVVDDATNHCYFWTQPVVDSIDLANNVCAAFAAHPVSFVDTAELQFVAAASKGLPNAVGGASWTALEHNPSKNDAGDSTFYVTFSSPQLPGWAASCPGCFAYTDASDIPLPPNNTSYPCVDWKHSLTTGWVQAPCSTVLSDAGTQTAVSVLCEREPPGSFSTKCPDDAVARTCIEVPVTRSKKRYDLSPAGTFQFAKNDCATRGGVLVHFQSAAEREEVVAEVRHATNNDFWIGLYYDVGKSGWWWVDGSAAPAVFPTPWADMEPQVNADMYAAAIHFAAPSEPSAYTTNLAHATDVTLTLPYVCEFAK